MGYYSSLLSNFFASGDNQEYVTSSQWTPFADTNPVPRLDDRLSDWYDSGKLTGRYANLIYGLMSADDSQVSSDLELLKAPIESARWYVEGGDEAVRQFVTDQLNLVGATSPNLNIDFGKVLREMLTAVDHGFSVHEVWYELRAGRNQLGGVELRWQNSIEEFRAKRGRLRSVVQLVKDADGGVKKVELRRRRLVYCAPRAVGDSWRGRSILRSAYRPWFAKSQVFYADLIGTRRTLIPVPLGKYAEGSQDLALERFRAQLEGLTSHEKSFLLLPDDYMSVEWLESGYSGPSYHLLDWRYRFYNLEISRALFGHILSLSESSSSNRGLSADLYQILFNFLSSYANAVRDALNRDLIARLVLLNFGESAAVPSLMWEDLDQTKILRIAEAVERVGRGGFLQPDASIDDSMRRGFGFPEREGDWTPPAPSSSSIVME